MMDFEEIYKTYWPKIFRLCVGFVNDPDWAKDIAQETFITAWQQLSTFRGESAIGTWLYRIATNHCLRQLDKSKTRQRKTAAVDLSAPGIPDIEGKTAFLYKCIAELAQTDRLIIGLELEDVKQAEIANIIGISEVNVRVRINRIKNKLIQKIKDYEQ